MYTVTDVSILLKVHPETVRRWIRDGKLESAQYSRKDGNIIEQESLDSFLEKFPKYRNKMHSTGITERDIAPISNKIEKIMVELEKLSKEYDKLNEQIYKLNILLDTYDEKGVEVLWIHLL